MKRVAPILLFTFSVANTLCAANLVTNPGFETLESTMGNRPTTFGNWVGDFSGIVSTQNGVTPFGDSRMLKFLGAKTNSLPSEFVGSEVIQLIDMSPFSNLISQSAANAVASMNVNRILGDSHTDTQFHIRIAAYSGSPSDFPYQINISELAISVNDVFSDGDPNTWEPVITALDIPASTDYLAVTVSAVEDVFNNVTEAEFDGHYADAVSLVINLEPGTLSAFSPTDGSENVPLDTNLSWEFYDPNNEFNESFSVFLSDDPNTLDEVASGLTDTTFDPGTLTPLTTYYWAVTLGEAPGPDDVRSFTTADAIAINPSPADGATGVTATPTLHWSGQGLVDSFDIYFGDDPNGIVDATPDSDLFLANLAGNFTAFDPTPESTILDPDTTYYWRIDQRLTDGSVRTGTVWSFTTIGFICSPSLIGDTNGDCVINMEDFIYLENHWLECHRIPLVFCP